MVSVDVVPELRCPQSSPSIEMVLQTISFRMVNPSRGVVLR
jgi:hypothetical protein